MLLVLATCTSPPAPPVPDMSDNDTSNLTHAERVIIGSHLKKCWKYDVGGNRAPDCGLHHPRPTFLPRLTTTESPANPPSPAKNSDAVVGSGTGRNS